MSWSQKNDGFHIDRIVSQYSCERHRADVGSPCWRLDSVHGPLRAICNSRALAAGAQGKVTPYTKYTKPKEQV